MSIRHQWNKNNIYKSQDMFWLLASSHGSDLRIRQAGSHASSGKSIKVRVGDILKWKGVAIPSKSFKIQTIYIHIYVFFFHLACLRIRFFCQGIDHLIHLTFRKVWHWKKPTKAFEQRNQGMLDVPQSRSQPTPVPSAARKSLSLVKQIRSASQHFR